MFSRFFQLHGDLDDLESALGGDNTSRSGVFGSGSCSALIKPLPMNSDLLVGHDTWTTYYSMLRIYKLYDFKFHMSHSDRKSLYVSDSSYQYTLAPLLSGPQLSRTSIIRIAIS